MADFSQIPWIAEHIALYRSDPEKAHHWDSGALGGPGVLPTLLLTTTGRKLYERFAGCQTASAVALVSLSFIKLKRECLSVIWN